MPARADPDDTILELAARQHGQVGRWQLLEAGVSADVVDRRLKKRRLRPVHWGVYSVGPLVSPLAREMAAVLACANRAVISHGSAAALLQLLPRDSSEPVEVTLPGSDHGRRPGIRAHRVRGLPADEVTEFDGIPITTAARTLLDLAGASGPCRRSDRELERVVAEVLSRRLASQAAVVKLLERYPRRSGSRRLRAIVDLGPPPLTRSEAEARFLALVRRGGLPAPETNVTLGSYQVDALWRAERLVVEVDGFAFHSSARMFESDRRRDATLAAAGVRVIRVTWRQIVGEPEGVLVRLAQALARTIIA
jgi:very-short-patch-repair endonuclease/predicted transcriptional regulator of viral defense system